MKIKVCGMRSPENILELGQLPVDMMGLIFYEKSPRYVSQPNLPELPIERVGVFVNAEIDFILEKVSQYRLSKVQLHGNESPDFCRELNEVLPVIKAFSIGNVQDMEQVTAYEGASSYFLFDTRTAQYGGSGEKFDWRILEAYTGSTPFLLSGGISIEDIETLRNMSYRPI